MAARQFSHWTHEATASDGAETRTGVAVEWYGSDDGAKVYVRTHDLQDGTETIHSGTMTVERTMRLGGKWGDSITNPIIGVTVASISGDVKGHGRSIKQAAEDFASKVLAEVLRAPKVETAETRRFKIEEAAATAHAYAAALSELSIVESDSDFELVAVVATLKRRLEAAKAIRDALRAGKPAPALSSIVPKSSIPAELAEVWCSRCELPSVIELGGVAYCATHGREARGLGPVDRDAGDPHAEGCTLFEDHPGQCRTLTARGWQALGTDELVMNPPIVTDHDAPAGAGESVEASRG